MRNDVPIFVNACESSSSSNRDVQKGKRRLQQGGIYVRMYKYVEVSARSNKFSATCLLLDLDRDTVSTA